ncbi:MAG: phosphotransferase [Oscillospiraceae bacterium]|nr:phosphotransferase [Oscillospiraceae bacterium]
MNLDNVIATRADKTIYRDGDAAIKVFNENYNTADVLNEALNTARIEETGLNIPKIREVTKIDGKWAIITDFVEGETLASLMEKNPDKEDEYLELFVDTQIEIQNKSCPMLTKIHDKMDRKISQSNLDATTRYELHTRLNGMKKHKKVCHGDYNPSNVIITAGGTPYVLDWSHATQGNASEDAARTYLLFKLAKKDELAEKYIRLFCKKSDTALQYVQSWLPIVAASQLVKNNPEEKEFLERWVNVVDYE